MAQQIIRVAHSPDSDDAFMFYALAEGKIDTGNLRYQHELSDIESLNRRALTGDLEVTAVSIHAYAYLAERYALLNSGSSMGDRYGPRLVSAAPRACDPATERPSGAGGDSAARESFRATERPSGAGGDSAARESFRAARPEEVRGKRIAVPGKLTTAYLALKLFQPDFVEVVVPFDQIEARVRQGEVDLGLLIHEGQLTYQDDGFHLWADLGEWWYGETGLPLPLGGNVVRRDLGPTIIQQVARDLKASIVYALEHRGPALEHAKRFNRGIGDEKTDRFVGMYVNEWTVDYGDRGRAAVRELLARGHRAGLIPHEVMVEFVG